MSNRAARLFASTAQRVFKLPPKLNPWQWMDKHVSVPAIGGAREPGQLDTGRCPPMRGLHELLWSKRVHWFTLAKSARIGGTLFSICAILYKIACSPGPIMWVDPSSQSANKFVRRELDPHLAECPPVNREAIRDKEHWTVKEKFFRNGSQLGIVGAGSPTDLAGRQAELVVINEGDKIRHTIAAEAPAHLLAEDRTKQFLYTRKILDNSTPTEEDKPTWQRFLAGSQHHCYLRFQCCGKYQRLTFFSVEAEVPFDEDLEPLPPGQKRLERTGKVKFGHLRRTEKRQDPQTGETVEVKLPYDLAQVEREAVYECTYCGGHTAQHALHSLLHDYRWMAHNPDAPEDRISAHIWSAYSPYELIGALAKKFLQCGHDAGALHNFHNSDLGLPFKLYAAEVQASDLERLQKASPEYLLGQIPYRPEALSMHVDVQGRGFWWSIWAWGILWDLPDQPSFAALVDYGEAVSWDQIETFAGIREKADGTLNTYRWRCPVTGEAEDFQVTIGTVDSGFEAQQEKHVYDFCVRNRAIFSPVKGGSRNQCRGAYIHLSPVYNDKLTLIWYWDDLFKQQLYYQVIKEGQHHRFLPRNLDQVFVDQLTDERTVPNGLGGMKWVGRDGKNKAVNNHLGDTWKHAEMMSGSIEEQLDFLREQKRAENSGVSP